VGQFADHLQRPVQRVDAVVADGQVVATDGALLLLYGQDLLRENGVGWPADVRCRSPHTVGREELELLYPRQLTAI
jgi:hypothetical protein